MLRFVLFMLLAFSQYLTVKGQICVEMSSESYAIFQGETFRATIKLNNVPDHTTAIVLLNGTPLELVDNTATYKAIGGSPGEYLAKIQIREIRQDGEILLEERTLKYLVIPPMVLFYASNDSYVYSNVWNKITILVPGVDPSRVTVNVDDGVVKANGAGKFDYMPSGNNRSVSLSAFVKMGDRLISMGSKKYIVHSIPQPQIELDYFTDSFGKQKISSMIKFSMPGGLSAYPWRVISWKLSIFHGGAWSYFEGNTGSFDLLSLLALHQLEKNDKVMLENVTLVSGVEPELIKTTGQLAITVNE